MMANIELPVEIEEALHRGAEGVGLLRTEYLYFQHRDIPSEDEQVATYSQVLQRLAGRTVVFRTLDVGGDKVSDYLGAKREYNPFLGWRGIRFSLSNRGLFKTQIRAIYQAGQHGDAHLMFPMITGVEELREAQAVCEEARAELTARGTPHPGRHAHRHHGGDAVGRHGGRPAGPRVRLHEHRLQRPHPVHPGHGPGQPARVVPVPAAASGHPAGHQAGGGRRHAAGIWVGLCGEMGSETRLAEVLLGLGLDEMSMHSAALPKIKQVIRWTTAGRGPARGGPS